MPHCAIEPQRERESAQGHTATAAILPLPCAHCPRPRRPSQLTVGVCVDGFHKEGISSIQALLQAGSGVLWPSRVQAYKDRLMSRPPFLSATGTLTDPQHTYLGSHSSLVSLNKDPKGGKLTQNPHTQGPPFHCL